MDRKQCDKCGKIFSPTAHNSGKVAISVYNGNHLSWSQGNVIYDFCPKCMTKIEKLILSEISNG